MPCSDRQRGPFYWAGAAAGVVQGSAEASATAAVAAGAAVGARVPPLITRAYATAGACAGVYQGCTRAAHATWILSFEKDEVTLRLRLGHFSPIRYGGLRGLWEHASPPADQAARHDAEEPVLGTPPLLSPRAPS